jgi:3-hydroxyisobutyrate dehydrogenase-like beta-hydroxyacid dehydrogenase
MSEILHIALIGYGEAGSILGRALRATGRCAVSTYDIKFDKTPPVRMPADQDIRFGHSAAEAAQGAALILSAVTASSAVAVAREAAGYLTSGQTFLDINSISPDAKKQNAATVEKSGASYVESAVMASVPPTGLKTPMLLGGKTAGPLSEKLNALGMNTKAVSDRIGVASAIKMCRSIMIKGLEAITIESFLTARRFGAEEQVIASLSDTFPNTDWNALGGYLISRAILHGRRRAAEMREAASTVTDAGIEPLMALATSRREDWMADLAQEIPELKRIPEKEWRQALDTILDTLETASRDDGHRKSAAR